MVIRERLRAWLAPDTPPSPKRRGRMAVANTEDALADAEGRASGPMTPGEADRLQERLRVFGRLDAAETRRLVDAYEPNMRLDPHDGARPLQASTVRGLRARNPRWTAPFMQNPRQALDYYLIDTIATMTPMQALISTRMRMTMGTGFRPSLYLKKPTADGKSGEEEEAARKADDERLKSLAWITDVMEAVDRRVGLGDGNTLKATVFTQFASLVRGTITYNRGALIVVPGPPLEVAGRRYEGLPGSLIYVHPKDLGLVELDGEENMTGVVSNWHGTIPVSDMVYLWNSHGGEERPRTKFYGNSMLDGAMATGRQMFRYQTETVPVMIKSSYTGAALITYRAPGVDDDAREAECRRLASMIRPGTLSVVSADGTEVDVHAIDIKPQLGDVVAHNTEQIKELCMHAEIPYSVVFDESASNRATLTGKLKYTKDTVIEPFRKWLDREVTPQWYGRMLTAICESAKRPGLLEEVGVELEWEDVPMDADENLVETMTAVDRRVPVDDAAWLRSVGRADLIKHVDPKEKARRQEAGEDMALGDDGAAPTRVTDAESGRRFKID